MGRARAWGLLLVALSSAPGMAGPLLWEKGSCQDKPHTRGAYCTLHFLAPRGWRDPFYGKRGPAKINLRRQRRHRWRHQWRHAAVLMKMGGGATRPVPRHAAARSGTDKNGRWHHTPCGALYSYRMEGIKFQLKSVPFSTWALVSQSICNRPALLVSSEGLLLRRA